MLLIPALDLRAGRCVRLLRGDFSRTTSYSEDPVATARGFAETGARWIHVVDLDAAEGKGADNRSVIAAIRRAVPCKLEVGGGVRSEEQAARLFDLGVDRIVLGTVLARSADEVAGWAVRLGSRFAAGIDAQDGKVKVAGWAEDAGRSDTDFAATLSGLGMKRLIYTNISRDGTLAGPDIPRTNAVAKASGLPTILSGGIGSDDDIARVARGRSSGVVGVILGKALYEGRVDLASLVERFPQESLTDWDD
jgi:phosphoribosylformimino-5-aminoimidazole carboxamide ribotide isomerase